MWTQLSGKKSLLVICKILGVFVNTMSVDDKYSVLNRGSLLQHFQMQLSQKSKIFSQFFVAFSTNFLINCLPMTSIPFWIETIYCNVFRWFYLGNEKVFLNFSRLFQNLNSILNIFKKEWLSYLMYFWTYFLPKT